jgi:hypothetical protein
MNSVKALRTLAIDNASTFLSLTANAIRSVFSEPIATVVADQAEQVTTFIEDSIAPELTNFTFAIHPGYITLSFSETVNMLSFDLLASTFTMGNNAVASSSYVLSGGVASESDSATAFNITLNDTDLNAIKANLVLGVNESTTFALITSGLIKDMNNNSIVAINNGSGLEAALIIGDFAEPTMVSFELDMNSSTAIIGYSETVLASTLNTTKLTIQQSNASSSGSPKQLTGGSATQLDDTRIVLTITNSDLNDIKADTDLCTEASNCFLHTDVDAIEDSSKNGVVASADGAAIGASQFTEDGSRPKLESFDLNISSGYGTVVLSFSETVDGARFTANALVLQSVSGSSNTSRTLSSNASLVAVENAAVLVVSLTKSDSDVIKNTLSLASDAASTFLSLSATAIVDTNNNSVAVVAASDALKVSNYTADGTAPMLNSFVLNLNNNTMILNFDEPVDVNSFDASNATVQASQDGATGSSVPLTGGPGVVSADGLQITLRLLETDVNSLTAAGDLAISTATTFLSFGSGLVNDTAGNSVSAISSSAAQQAALHTEDSTAATLSGFDLNMNAETLTLHFNETMNASSLVIGGITLQVSSNSTADGQHQLNSSSVVTSSPGLDLVISLSLDDLNTMKLKQIGTSEISSFVVMEQGTVKDMTGVGANAVVNGVNAIAVDDFVVDSTSPVLKSFDLDVNSSTATLRFSEVVNTATFNGTDLLVQNVNKTVQVCPCGVCLDNEFMAANCSLGVATNCTVCKECEIGFYETVACSFDADAECTACEECAAGKYLTEWCSGNQSTVCEDCTDSNCADCTGSGNACVECAAGFILTDGACVSTCAAGTYNATTSRGQQCRPCDASCETCTGGESNQCTACPPSGAFVLFGGECTDFGTANTCPQPGLFLEDSVCKECSAGCDSCFGTNSTSCLSCNSSMVLVDRRTCL